MKNDKFHIYLSDAERTQVIQTLIELKNSLLEQGKYAYRGRHPKSNREILSELAKGKVGMR